MRSIVTRRLCVGVLALGAMFVPPPSGNATDYAQEEAKRQLTQPGDNAPVWPPEILARQTPAAMTMHQKFLAKESTCIDCHQGLDHAALGS